MSSERAGAKAAQRRGAKFGRKVKLTSEQIDHARKLVDKGEAPQYPADLPDPGRSTLYRALVSRWFDLRAGLFKLKHLHLSQKMFASSGLAFQFGR